MRTIEEIAMILIHHKIAFNYDGDFLIVKDVLVSTDIFKTASYHTDTNELILMDYNDNLVSHQSFTNYFQYHYKL